MTSREKVIRALEFRSSGEIPRHLWTLPIAWDLYPEILRRIGEDFPDDIAYAPAVYGTPPPESGDPYKPGKYTDPWGCVFTNISAGTIGEVKEPQIPEDDTEWESAASIRFPEEFLTFSESDVNRFCSQSSRFILAGIVPRPFEQLQFIRGTAPLYMDLMDPPRDMKLFMARMQDLYCRVLEKWAKTDVDGLVFMDDWGAQNNLLISPALWTEYFKPLYRDYIQIAHARGKKAFMHSDGHILRILPDLVELGLDAVNSQIFCMGLEDLKPFRGKITFWGEMDRQHLLPYASAEEIDRAVRDVHAALWQDGGCIAQCEFGAGARPDNVYQVFRSWDRLSR